MKISSLQTGSRRAFTLVELLVATVVLVIILLMLVAMVNQTATIWKNTATKVEQFRSARSAFESVNRHLSQATLNTYFDYGRDKTTNQIDKYIRQSDLRFIVGSTQELVPNKESIQGDRPPQQGPGHAVFFNAPLGYVSSDTETLDSSGASSLYNQMDNLLNTWGYYIEFGSDYNYRPPFLNTSAGSFRSPPERYRYRLMEFMLPADQLTIYRYTAKDSTLYPYYARDWFDSFLKLAATPTLASGSTKTNQVRPVHLLAENIVNFVVFPQLSRKDQESVNAASTTTDPLLAPGYAYNSTNDPRATVSGPRTDQKNQLPPVIQVTMVAIDETSAARLAAQQAKSDGTQPPDAIRSMMTPLFSTTSVIDPQGGSAPPNSDSGGDPRGAKYYNRDMKTLQEQLVSKKISYRIFTTSLSLRAAKWSQD